ncbi:MAG: thioredoxin domain-containing protein [Bacteroidales bacterium]|nr:thioredoxin domain-containing protein [Bacteroidales bacterium]
MSIFSNRLASETSSYLLQHATNPVDWYPWGDEAFNKAKLENKLVLVSIGYSSCHWCHVMEREAFSNTEVTEFMNNNFVNIKVDREERPDIDQIYMNAVQIINRNGGWPLNCFTLPNGKPVFGGTYFSIKDWLDVLKNLNNTWINDSNRIIDVAEELSQSVGGTEVIRFKRDIDTFSTDVLKNYSSSLKKLFDTRNGGIKGAPKFPMPGLLDYLLEYAYHLPDKEMLDYVFLTLNKIASGGIYDHLGGGFSRYTVDENWHIPHFEKMLYDNAQLISIYSKAYRINPDKHYLDAVKYSIDFVINELRAPEGGFYSSYDADSEGHEGTYYIWTKQELEAILKEDAELFSVAYGVTATGNFNKSNVLIQSASNEQLASIFSLDIQTVELKILQSKHKLIEHRKLRVKPALDDKIILSWNSLMISALTEAYISFGEANYLEAATGCANYIQEYHYSDNQLKRVYCKGKLAINCLLEDYAHLIKAYVSIYKITLDKKWVNNAESLLTTVIENFYDESSGMFFYASTIENKLIARKMDLTDGVTPSSGSIMAQALFEIGTILKKDEYILMSNQMLANISDSLNHGGPYVFGWAKLVLMQQLSAIHLTINPDIHKFQLNQILSKVLCSTIFTSVSLSSTQCTETANNIKICIGKSCYPTSSDTNYYVDLINSTKI